MKDGSWEDLQLFLHVAENGGLTGAAEASGVSAPTIGRRMLVLEGTLGRSLFERSPLGYRLTVDGQMLSEHVRSMDQAARAISEWQDEVLKRPIVSFGADALTLRFIASRLDRFWSASDSFRLCFKTLSRVDLTYREANVAIAPSRPKAGNVAARRSVSRSYAPYCAKRFNRDANPDWVSLGTDAATEAWERWVFQQPHPFITAWTNTTHGHLDLVLNGAGRSVLPVFVGDAEQELVRCGELIPELRHDTWIVMHDDDRHRAEIRTLIDRLTGLLDENRMLFAGSD